MNAHELNTSQRVQQAQKRFLEQSAPYFAEIARIHNHAKKQFVLTDDLKIVDWNPVFTEDVQKTLKMIYESIDIIKQSCITDFKLEGYL